MSTYVNAEQRMDQMTGQARELAKALHDFPRGHALAAYVERAGEDTETLEALRKLRSRIDGYLTEHDTTAETE